MFLNVVLCKIVTATTFLRFVTVTEHVDIRDHFKEPPITYFHGSYFVYEMSSVDKALMPLTPRSSLYKMTYNENENSLDYLTGDDLIARINDTAENDRSLVRFDRSTQQYLFPRCSNCQAPKIVHRSYDFKNCSRKPSQELVEMIVHQLRQVEGLEKFGIIDGIDTINKIGTASKRARSEDLPDEIPEGKKLDDKLTPSKLQQNIMGIDNCDVIDVFTVDISDHLEKVKKSSDDRIKSLQALISSLDQSNDSNKVAIGTLTAQIAQIEMARETSICSMSNMPSSGSNDIKIEKQRFCPSWSDKLKYEAFRKQLR